MRRKLAHRGKLHRVADLSQLVSFCARFIGHLHIVGQSVYQPSRVAKLLRSCNPRLSEESLGDGACEFSTFKINFVPNREGLTTYGRRALHRIRYCIAINAVMATRAAATTIVRVRVSAQFATTTILRNRVDRDKLAARVTGNFKRHRLGTRHMSTESPLSKQRRNTPCQAEDDPATACNKLPHGQHCKEQPAVHAGIRQQAHPGDRNADAKQDTSCHVVAAIHDDRRGEGHNVEYRKECQFQRDGPISWTLRN